MSTISRREFLRISSTVVAGALLTACGAQPTPEATKAPEAQKLEQKPTETPKAPERPKTFPLGDVPRNRTLVYKYQSAPANGVFSAMNPGMNHQVGNAILYEPCAFYGAHADKTYMWLAESYKYNADATECTITFRKGIKWSDGTPFTAQDPAWSMETLKRVPGLRTAGTYVKELEKAEAVDDLDLKVSLNQPDWRFFFKSLTFRFDLGDPSAVQPMHIFKDIPDADLVSFKFWDPAKDWPVSTGPWGVGESVEQSTNYDLRPSWWAVETGFTAKEPDVWRLVQSLHTSDTLSAQLLINKELDQSLSMIPAVVASTLLQADHLSTWTGRKPPYGYTDWWPISVQFCTQKPPFDNPKVRWAVSYALDKQKIVDIGLIGAAVVTNNPFPAFPKLNVYMDGIKDLTEKYNVLEFNLEKSAQLMQEAGLTKNADGWWADKDGVAIDADLYAAVPLFSDIAPVIAEQLRTAGFKCDHKAPPDVWAAKVDGRASMFLFGHGGGTIDPYDTFFLYHEPPAKMGEQSWGNITRWQNPDFIAVTDEMNNTPIDDPKMKELFRRGMELYYQDLPDCPIHQFYHRLPVNHWYWENWPDEKNPYMNSALWHLTAMVVMLGLKATGKT